MSYATDAVRERAATVRERVRSVVGTATENAPDSWTGPVRLTAGLVAVLGLGALTATRILLNAPIPLPGVVSGVWFDTATTAAVVAPALGALLLGSTARDGWTRIGLSLAGAFGLVSAVTGTVAVTAVGALLLGGWLTLVGTVTTARSSSRPRARTGIVSTLLLAGLTLSLLGAVGVRSATVRPVGTTVTLVGMAATPFAFRPRTNSFVVGGIAAAVTAHLTGAAPFVSGAVILVAGSVVGASTLVLAAAVGGLATTVSTGIANRQVAPAATGALLLSAGVPSSIPRALGTVLAVALVAATLHDTNGDPI